MERTACRRAAAATYAAARTARSSTRWTRLTGVPAARTGSVQPNGARPAARRKPSMRVRSSMKWTARTGVTPGPDGVVGE